MPARILIAEDDDGLAFVVRDSGLSLAVAAGETAAELSRLGVAVRDLTPRPPSLRGKGEKDLFPPPRLGEGGRGERLGAGPVR